MNAKGFGPSDKSTQRGELPTRHCRPWLFSPAARLWWMSRVAVSGRRQACGVDGRARPEADAVGDGAGRGCGRGRGEAGGWARAPREGVG